MDRTQLKTRRQLQKELYEWAQNFENTCKYAAELEERKAAGEDVSELQEEGDDYFAFSEIMIADLATQVISFTQKVLARQHYIAKCTVCGCGMEVAEKLSKYTYLDVEDFENSL